MAKFMQKILKREEGLSLRFLYRQDEGIKFCVHIIFVEFLCFLLRLEDQISDRSVCSQLAS